MVLCLPGFKEWREICLYINRQPWLLYEADDRIRFFVFYHQVCSLVIPCASFARMVQITYVTKY